MCRTTSIRTRSPTLELFPRRTPTKCTLLTSPFPPRSTEIRGNGRNHHIPRTTRFQACLSARVQPIPVDRNGLQCGPRSMGTVREERRSDEVEQ